MYFGCLNFYLDVCRVFWISGLVCGCLDLYFWCLDLYFECLDLYFGCLDLNSWCVDLYLGVWACMLVSGLIFECLDLYLGVWTCIWVSGLVFGCLVLYLGVWTCISGVWTLEMCSCTRFNHFLWNFANMASPAEMTITTRTASKFCARRRAVQLPIFFLELISLVTTGIPEPWPECQPKLYV